MSFIHSCCLSSGREVCCSASQVSLTGWRCPTPVLFPAGLPLLFRGSEQIYPCGNLWSRVTRSWSPLFNKSFRSNRLHFCVYQIPQTHIIHTCCNTTGGVPETPELLCALYFSIAIFHGLACTSYSEAPNSLLGATPVSFHGPHCPEGFFPCQSYQLSYTSPRMLKSLHILALFRVVRQ